MSDNQVIRLVCICSTISDLYESELFYVSQRFSNNNEPEFTDQEVLTVFLYAINLEKRLTITLIYKFANNHLLSWFPKLPSYVAFVKRLNRLGEAFRILVTFLLCARVPVACRADFSVLDSMPIITCPGKKSTRVALEMTDKSYSTNQFFNLFNGILLNLYLFHCTIFPAR